MRIKSLLLEDVILPLGDRVLRSKFIKKLKAWRKIVAMDKSSLQQLQAEKLTQLLTFASSQSPYYKSLEIPANEDPYTWLQSFPVLAKQTFKDRLTEFVTVQDLDSYTGITSSGSTGAPSKVYFSKDELSNNRALQVLWWEWAGYNFGNSLLQTGVNMKRTTEKAIKDKLLNTRYIDALSHDEAQILSELYLLRKNPRDHFVAYASSLYLFAKTALDHNILDVKFKSVISLGEKLLPNFKETIEKAFSCKVYDTYGASEGFLIASQCKEGNYHVISPHLVLELLDEEGNEVKAGETGRVVLTGLDNYTTPLIRYEVGDLAVKATDTHCACGLELPRIGEIIGRITEFILSPSGKYITVQTVVRVMKQFSDIDQFKLIQSQENKLKLIYTSKKSTEAIDVDAIKRAYMQFFSPDLEMEFEHVDLLPKAKSGKFQLIENHLK